MTKRRQAPRSSRRRIFTQVHDELLPPVLERLLGRDARIEEPSAHRRVPAPLRVVGEVGLAPVRF